MTLAIGRQAKQEIWKRLQVQGLAKPTPLQIKLYRKSKLRKKIIAKIHSIENIENIENIYCHSLLVQYNTIQYNTMLFVYRMYTKSIFF